MGILSNVRIRRKSKIAAINQKCIGNNVYLSSYTRQQRNSNGYIPMFSGFSDTLELMQMNPDVGMTVKSQVATIFWKYICNNEYLGLYT